MLAGGAGTRFWPAGRRSRPKQVLALCGDDPRPLLEVTLARVAPLGAGPAWLLAPAALGPVLRRAAPAARPARLLPEPAARNTAPAIALAAFEAARSDPDQVLLVVPADHHVAPLGAYRRALSAMCRRAATSDALLTLGLRPTRPATGYGWLEAGPALSGARGLFAVRRFVEKPALARARRFLAGGRHLWNGGTFAFRAGVFLEQLRRHLPAVAGPLARAHARPGARARAAAIARAWRRLPSISVDHGVMERADRVEVIRAELDWDDLGSWDAVARHRPQDARGNSVRGPAALVDSRRCLVEAQEGLVALLGVSDLIVVRTADAVLVARRGQGEAVRRLVAALEREGRGEALA